VAERLNEFGQPVGPAMPDDWAGCDPPSRAPLVGQYCQVVPLVIADHAASLYHELSCDDSDANWTYLSCGPFGDFESFCHWLETSCLGDDPMFFVVEEAGTGGPLGLAAYMNIKPEWGSLEVGHIHFSNAMQRTPMATEAMYLMMAYAFDELGYRRYEWKCDALNARSRKAADRLGFRFEGVFRQAMVYNGRSRDTAWYSVIDEEWAEMKVGYEAWLDVGNFEKSGIQATPLQTKRNP